MGIAMRDSVNRDNGIHPNGGADSIGIGIIPCALGIIIVATVDVHHGILIKVILVQRVGQQVTIHRLQLRLGVDVYVVHIREHSCISHANDFHVVGMDDIVGHIVFRTHAIELQRILLRNERNELGGIIVHGQQLLMCCCSGIVTETFHRII